MSKQLWVAILWSWARARGSCRTPWNFTPLIAMALFAGVQANKRGRRALTIVVMLAIGDAIMGLYDWLPVRVRGGTSSGVPGKTDSRTRRRRIHRVDGARLQPVLLCDYEFHGLGDRHSVSTYFRRARYLLYRSRSVLSQSTPGRRCLYHRDLRRIRPDPASSRTHAPGRITCALFPCSPARPRRFAR